MENKATLVEKLLVYGLTLYEMDIDTQDAIFLMLKTEEQKLRMIAFLQENPKAQEQEILNETTRIIDMTRDDKNRDKRYS